MVSLLVIVVAGVTIGIFVGAWLLGDDAGPLAFLSQGETTTTLTAAELHQRDHLLGQLPIIAGRYHSTPEMLMDDFMNVLSLLYGPYLDDELMFTEVIRVQRTLFGQELLALNSMDSQTQQFIATARTNWSQGVYQSAIELIAIQFETDYTVAYVRQYFENLGTVNWVYFINYDQGFKVSSFFQADDDFVPIAGWLDQ